MIVKGGFVHVAFALIKRITIVCVAFREDWNIAKYQEK